MERGEADHPGRPVSGRVEAREYETVVVDWASRPRLDHERVR